LAKRRRKVALVCAGGGITGAVYEIGCLRALEELLGRSVTDLDLYVGVSGGAFVSSLLAAGISPREMFEQITSRTASPFGVAAASLFRLNVLEFAKRSLRAPGVLSRALATALTGEGRNLSDLVWSAFALLPPGLMETSGIREYLQAVLRSRNRADRFDDLSRPLFVVAVDLDRGEAVAFGDDGFADVPVSKAVEASTALPGLYRPVRIDGRDYVDGGVQKTAHIKLAIDHGADLVICINPLVPIFNDTSASDGPLGGPLSERGVTYVLDQALRIMLHGRMKYGMERYRREHPDVDIVLIEPTRDDLRMFSYNIMKYSARQVVAEHGYRSTVQFFRERRASLARIFARHGIRLADPADVPAEPDRHPYRSPVARSLDASLERLSSRVRSRTKPVLRSRLPASRDAHEEGRSDGGSQGGSGMDGKPARGKRAREARERRLRR
jgi:predicted acylesterase/phospholipase RssA